MATLEPPKVVNLTEGAVLGKKDGEPYGYTDSELADKIAGTGTLVTADGLDADTAALVNDGGSATRAALDQQYVTVDSVVEGVVDVTDPAMAAAVADANSAVRAALDAIYLNRQRTAIYDIRDYGAKVDGKWLHDVSITAASNALSSASYTFTDDDIGKVVGISGAGHESNDYVSNANDGVLIATIESVSNGDAVLSVAAENTVTDATCCFGTPDDAAIQTAHTAAAQAGGGTIYLPPGITIVSDNVQIEDYVSWTGAGRDVSWVVVIKSVVGTEVWQCSWLHTSGKSWSAPLTGVNLSHFGIDARYHIRPDGWLTRLKPLNIYYVKRCTAHDLNVWHTPATAIPFDTMFEGCIVANNIIVNPGRLWSEGEYGGSGIGIGTVPIDWNEPGWIVGNSIIGVGTPDTETHGNNGIFVEAQAADGGDPSTGSPGYRIIGNYVQGMRTGLADNGSRGTIWTGNTTRWCKRGFYHAKTLTGSFPGRGARVFGNQFLDNIRPTGESWVYGAGLVIVTTSSSDVDQFDFFDNTIDGCAGFGMYLLAFTFDATGIRINRNVIANTQRVGVFIEGQDGAEFNDLDFCDNTIINAGVADVAGEDAGIRISGGVTLNAPRICRNRVDAPNGTGIAALAGSTINGGRIQDNDFGSAFMAGSTSGTIITGNTGSGITPSVSASDLATLLAALEALGLVEDAS